jgi:hypothetical protein
MQPTQTGIDRKKYTFCIIKLFEPLKKFKSRPDPLLRLRITILDLKKPNTFCKTVPLNNDEDFAKFAVHS